MLDEGDLIMWPPLRTARLVLNVDDENEFHAHSPVEVVTPFEDTHYGTREMVWPDPDGGCGRCRLRRTKLRINR